MQRARHLALPFALATRLRQSRATFQRETFETQQRIGRETKEERRRETRASRMIKVVYVCARAHAERIPESVY